ncbi:MAG TPA: ATP-binding protein [Longimicrobiales bacterium]|nr:ATP-binding protein [Longimicrobiales bacterium]
MGQGRTAPHDGGRLLELGVAPVPSALPELRHALGELDLPPEMLEEARLLLTELVSNCIRHAGLRLTDLILVRATWDGTRLRVEVRDGGPSGIRAPVAGSIRPPPGAESGWGLYLVDRLATRWGRGKGAHWFELGPGPQA